MKKIVLTAAILTAVAIAALGWRLRADGQNVSHAIEIQNTNLRLVQLEHRMDLVNRRQQALLSNGLATPLKAGVKQHS